MNKIRRRHIIFYIITISFISLFVIFQSYDEYSRNSSINDTNRVILERYLSQDEKTFLIDNNIDVNIFLPFISYNNFNLLNYEYYDLIFKYFKDKDKQEIVSAGNFFVKEEFTLRSLDKIFKNKMYDVNQLINLVENNRNNELKIEFYPKNWNALSNFEYTINDFKPNDLVIISKNFTEKKLYLRQEANNGLNLLCNALENINSQKCGGLEVEYAFISYDALKKAPKKYPSFIEPGQNDFQLGNTISFRNSKIFNRNKFFSFLKQNSYKYGFVLRYPNEKVDITKVENQYGVFRYVGVEQATKMFNENKVIEEMR